MRTQLNEIGPIRRREGYTLLEILVVIAIIGILAGLLLPTMRSARSRARSVICMNNLKQIYTAMTLYASDFKVWPSRGESGEDYGSSIWIGLGPVNCCTGNQRICAAHPAMPWNGALARYILPGGNSNALANATFMCQDTKIMSPDTYMASINMCYVMNGQLGNFTIPGTVRYPGGTYFFFEARHNYCGVDTPNDASHVGCCDKSSMVHYGGGHHVYCDGHVMWRRAVDVDNDICNGYGLYASGSPRTASGN